MEISFFARFLIDRFTNRCYQQEFWPFSFILTNDCLANPSFKHKSTTTCCLYFIYAFWKSGIFGFARRRRQCILGWPQEFEYISKVKLDLLKIVFCRQAVSRTTLRDANCDQLNCRKENWARDWLRRVQVLYRFDRKSAR